MEDRITSLLASSRGVPGWSGPLASIPLRCLQERPQAPLATERKLLAPHDQRDGDFRRCHLDPANGVADPFTARGIVGAHLEHLELLGEPLQSLLPEGRERHLR